MLCSVILVHHQVVGCVGLRIPVSLNTNSLLKIFREYEHMHTNEINEHFLNKNIPDYWKVWNKKFKRSLSCGVKINGLDDDWCIAEEFSCHFANVYDLAYANSDGTSDGAEMADYCNDSDTSCINFKLIDTCVRGLKCGKDCGPDNLMSEYLIHAHPSIVSLRARSHYGHVLQK